MKEMDDLVEISDILMGPEGCPWDAKQTFYSLQKHFLEEVQEVIEAIDENHSEHILEELGDVFYLVLFAAKIAAKQGDFTLKQLLEKQKEKLIRRHPHVFAKKGNEKISMEDLEKQWTEIKKKESQGKKKTTPFTKLPKNISLLQKSQHILQELEKQEDFPLESVIDQLERPFQKKFFTLLHQAVLEKESDAEGEIRRGIQALEQAFLSIEKKLPEKS